MAWITWWEGCWCWCFFCLEDLLFFSGGGRIWVVVFWGFLGVFWGGGDGETKKWYGKKSPSEVSWWWVLWDCLGLSQWFEGWIKWVLMISWFCNTMPMSCFPKKYSKCCESKKTDRTVSNSEFPKIYRGLYNCCAYIYIYIINTYCIHRFCSAVAHFLWKNPLNAVKMGRSCWSLVSSTKATKSHLAIRTYEGESPSTKQGILC